MMTSFTWTMADGTTGWVRQSSIERIASPEELRRTMHVVLIEDDEKIGGFVSRGLKQEGHVVSWARTGDEGLALGATPAPISRSST
jgi:hypothetical protein